ncbi:MAG: sugar phosphate isomerase/epimerase [Thermoguttaceae bacterium]|jgi:sugar phosphate isomerase/epimerase
MKVHCSVLALVLAALASWPTVASAAKRDDSASEKLGFKLSLQCWTFNRLTFFETVDKAAELGIKYLEMFPGQKLKPGSNASIGPDMSEETIREIKQKLADAGGLKVVAYGVAGVPTDEQGARKMCEWAKKLGIQVFVTETTPVAIHDKLCEEYNIRYALHNHPQSWPPEKVLSACKGHCKLIGSCSDTGHWMRANRVPVDMLKKLQGRVEHLHFKDLDQFGGGHDVPWGTGKGNPKAMLEELQRQGFQGYFSIEYEYGSLDDLAKELPQCVAFFDKTLGELAK